MRGLSRFLAVAAAGVLGHGLVRFATAAYLYLASPYSRDYGEGCVLAMVQLLHEHGTYFRPLTDYPFVHGNYPPVFIVLVWPFYAWLGPSLLAPRLLSLIATAALVVVLVALARRASGSAWLAAAAGALFLAPWFVQTWAPMGRVDMLACLLSLAGLGVVARGGDPRWAFPLFWLGFFTKQNALLAPAAVLLHVWMENGSRRFVQASLTFVVPLAVLFGALALATGGESYRHLVLYTAAAEYEWGRMAESYVELLRVAGPLLAAIAWTAWRAPSRFTSGVGRLLILYWGLNLVALVTIAKAGAAQNYFIEPWLATVAATAVAWPAFVAKLSRPGPVVAGLILAAAAVALYTDGTAHRPPPSIRHPERARDFRDLWTTVRATEGPILSENLAVLVVHRKPVLVEPFGMLLLAQTGLFRPDRIVRDCEAARFALIVSEHRLERLPGFEACLQTRYEAWKDLATYRLYRPVANATASPPR
jgi:hypothetical protein